MIYSDRSPITFEDSLPGHADVVVIGAGIIGISTAWYLARAGVSCLVCDKGRVAGEQSSRNWGWVRQQGRDPAELPIMMESNGIWKTLNREINDDSGFRQHGVMYVGETERDMADYEDWVALARDHDLHSELLSKSQIDDSVKGFNGDWKGGVITPSDGRAEPFVAVPAIARDCQKRGVIIVENCAVRSLVYAAGSPAGVVTERGEVKCSAVVLAGGAWSSLFSANAGASFPQLSVRATVTRTAEAPDIYQGNVACDDIAIRRRLDGGYTVAPAGFHEHLVNLDSVRHFGRFLPGLWREFRHSGSLGDTRLRLGSDVPGGWRGKRRWRADEITPFEQTRVLNPEPARSTLSRLRKRLAKRLPKLAELPLIETWAGMIDVTPDVVPVMDQVPDQSGFFIASGFSGHGFGIGPAAGRIMADLVQGNEPGHDLSRFRLSRFTDGSQLYAGPTI